MYAKVVNGVVARTGGLPQTETLPDGRVLTNFQTANDATLAFAGWLPLIVVQATPGPNQTLGNPVYTIGPTSVAANYPARAMNAGELAAQQANTNQGDIRTQAAAALAGLQAIIDAPAIAAGTLPAAQLSNAVRQLQDAVVLEARALRRLIRLALDDYTGTN